MTAGAFWTDAAVKVISCLCAIILVSIALAVFLPLETEALIQIANRVACGMIVLWCLPVLRNTRRRLRDAGYTAKAYLWLLLPVIGWIIFIALLCKKGLPIKSSELNY